MNPAYIFDLDGTLLDTLSSLAASYNRTLLAFGFPTHAEEKYRYFVGDGARVCARRCLPPEADDALVSEFLDVQLADYEDTWQTAAPYPGVPALIDELTARGADLAVLSNKHHPFTVKCIEHFFPDVFDVVQGYTGEHPHKPDPAGARDVCRRLGYDPQDVTFVGDTSTDIRTAVACGNRSVGVLWGFRTADELIEAGADRLIESPMELLT